jgi:cellobiose epimerase
MKVEIYSDIVCPRACNRAGMEILLVLALRGVFNPPAQDGCREHLQPTRANGCPPLTERIAMSPYPARWLTWLLLLLTLPILAGCAGLQRMGERDRQLADQIEAELRAEIDAWYPRTLDREFGGFLSDFDYAWRPTADQNKMIVTQARHLWTLSRIAGRYPERPEYAEFARHGFEFLRDRMWDPQHGGFFWMVTRAGEPVPSAEGDLRKTLYGNAFAIYALAAYHSHSGNPEVLQLAQRAFHWLDRHAHDPVHGGYFEHLARDGTPDTTGYPKDYNSGIHMLEALAELHLTWPDPLVRSRLEESFHIIRDRVVAPQGYMRLYFTPDWTPLSLRDSSEAYIRANLGRDHASPGHDIETAFLLLEAAHALGIDEDPETHRIARRMTDHSLDVGWDPATGGLFDAGFFFRGQDSMTVLRRTKAWWAQAEALHTLAIMARLYPEDPRYRDKLHQQWQHIRTYLIDPEHGGWYPNSLDTDPNSRMSRKAQVWKGNYHTVRSLMGAADWLRR